jgi:hypothetical protein
MLSRADLFLAFDHVQFERKSWQQRNNIWSERGPKLLSVPVTKAPRSTRICDIQICDRENWAPSHWAFIKNTYLKAPYYGDYASGLSEAYSARWASLAELNISLIQLLASFLGIELKVLRTSSLALGDPAAHTKTERVANICVAAGAERLLDGASAASFLDPEPFARAGVQVLIQNYNHPTYRQPAGRPFIPYLSVIDLLFNEGPRSAEILRKGGIYSELTQARSGQPASINDAAADAL